MANLIAPHYFQPISDKWKLGQVRTIGINHTCYKNKTTYSFTNYWTGRGWASNGCYSKRYTPFMAHLVCFYLRLRKLFPFGDTYKHTIGKIYVLRFYGDNGGNKGQYR